MTYVPNAYNMLNKRFFEIYRKCDNLGIYKKKTTLQQFDKMDFGSIHGTKRMDCISVSARPVSLMI